MLLRVGLGRRQPGTRLPVHQDVPDARPGTADPDIGISPARYLRRRRCAHRSMMANKPKGATDKSSRTARFPAGPTPG